MKNFLKNYWNGSLFGAPKAIWVFSSSVIMRSLDLINTFFWRFNFGAFGKNSIVQYGATIRSPKNIKINTNVNIGRNVFLTTEINSSKLEIGADTLINKNTTIDFSGNVKIGKKVTISEDVMLQSHSHGLNPRNKPIGLELTIEDNVWIGTKAIILSNTNRIGKNSIVAAGTIVTKEVPPNCIVAGSPSKIIKEL